MNIKHHDDIKRWLSIKPHNYEELKKAKAEVREIIDVLKAKNKYFEEQYKKLIDEFSPIHCDLYTAYRNDDEDVSLFRADIVRIRQLWYQIGSKMLEIGSEINDLKKAKAIISDRINKIYPHLFAFEELHGEYDQDSETLFTLYMAGR